MKNSTAPSAVRDALAELPTEETVLPLTPEEVEAVGKVLFWRVLIEPYVPKYEGALAVAAQVDDAERVLSKVGRILQIGHFAFRSKTSAGLDLSEEPNRPQVGDYVLYEQYAGQEIHLRSKNILRIMNETEILMVIRDPRTVRAYL